MSDDVRQVLREGMTAGLAGYLAVVVFFLVWNLVQGRPALYTPAVLGEAFIPGSPDGSVDPLVPALSWNGVHLFLSLVLGTAAAVLLMVVERLHSLWYLGVFLGMAGVLAGVAAVGALAAEARPLLQWSEVLAGNVLGAAATVGVLLWLHRGLASGLVGETRSGAD